MIEIDDYGEGDLNFDTNFEPGLDDPATRFPADFPQLFAGLTVVEVLSSEYVLVLSETLQTK